MCSAPKISTPPAAPPPPREVTADARRKREQEKQKGLLASGFQGTLLTGAGGLGGQAAVGAKTLLGQ